MASQVIKSIKQEIGIPSGLRLKTYRRKPRKNTFSFYLITVGGDFWDGAGVSDYADATVYQDEDEAINQASGIPSAKVILNYGYPTENVVYQSY